jgi:murein DD-endopeptidase MepM/ murein hydrolase activator NlpD
LVPPIQGATFSLAAGHLPGAPREYRDGIHQGFDFVNGTAGRPLAENHPVVAIGDGQVLRMDHQYPDPPPETIQHWSTLASEPGFTGAHALDRLRGRQVWIRHADGHVSRYAHLSAVNPDIQPGDEVTRGQALGQTGVSGLPPAADPVPHLHFELWSPDGGQYLCREAKPLDCHRQVRAVFGETALPRHARRVLAAVDEGEPPPETWPPEPLSDTGFSVNPPQPMPTGSAFAVPATVVGDAVNEAARLQELTRERAEPVLVSGRTVAEHGLDTQFYSWYYLLGRVSGSSSFRSERLAPSIE